MVAVLAMSAMVMAISGLCLWAMYVQNVRITPKASPSGTAVAATSPPAELEFLVRRAWRTADATAERHFDLLPSDIDVTDSSEVARRMLMHMRRVATGF